MPKKTGLSKSILYVAVLGLFVAAVVVSFISHRSEGIVGIMLMVAGLGAILFSQTLTEAQKELSERPYIPVRIFQSVYSKLLDKCSPTNICALGYRCIYCRYSKCLYMVSTHNPSFNRNARSFSPQPTSPNIANLALLL